MGVFFEAQCNDV